MLKYTYMNEGENPEMPSRKNKNIPSFFNNAINNTQADFAFSNPARSNKKKIIIAIIIALLVIGVIIGVVFFINSLNTPNKKRLADKYYKYANYVLSEKDTNEPFEKDYSPNEKYAFYDYNKKDNKEERLQKIKSLSEDYYREFENYKPSDNNSEDYKQLAAYTKEQNDQIQALLVISSKKMPNMSDVFLHFSNNGRAASEKYFMNYYGDYDENNYIINEYMSTYRKWYSAIISIYNIYDAANCLSPSKTGGSRYCIEQTKNDKLQGDLKQLTDDSGKLYLEMISTADVTKNYIYNLIQISHFIKDNNNEK